MNKNHTFDPLAYREALFSLFHLGMLAGFLFAVMTELKGIDSDESDGETLETER